MRTQIKSMLTGYRILVGTLLVLVTPSPGFAACSGLLCPACYVDSCYYWAPAYITAGPVACYENWTQAEDSLTCPQEEGISKNGSVTMTQETVATYSMSGEMGYADFGLTYSQSNSQSIASACTIGSSAIVCPGGGESLFLEWCVEGSRRYSVAYYNRKLMVKFTAGTDVYECSSATGGSEYCSKSGRLKTFVKQRCSACEIERLGLTPCSDLP